MRRKTKLAGTGTALRHDAHPRSAPAPIRTGSGVAVVPAASGRHHVFADILAATVNAVREVYGDRLVALAVFGSVGRDTMRPDSDVDLLVVADPLPQGRMRRVREFDAVEGAVAPVLRRLADTCAVHSRLSPVFRTPAEVCAGSPLLLDMTEDAQVLFDRNGFLAGALQALRAKLSALNASLVFRGNAWWWDLKPDFKPGDVVEL